MSEPLGHDIIERCLRLLGHDPHPPSCATSILASLDEAGLRIIAQCEAGLPASGGVSGDDGGLSPEDRDTLTALAKRLGHNAAHGVITSIYTEDADEIGAALAALLAERDGLKQKVAELNREAVEYDDILKGLPKLYAERASASNAALADALGLLRSASGYLIHTQFPDLAQEILSFLAKHGKTEEAK